MFKKTNNFIVGELYSDISPEANWKTVLEFVKEEKGLIFFKYVEGGKFYLEDESGLIKFFKDSLFYKIENGNN